MPITSQKGMVRMAELALGARFPAKLLREMPSESRAMKMPKQVGSHWATETGHGSDRP